MKALKNSLLIVALLALVACASDATKPEDMTEQELYDEIQQNLDNNNYLSAVKNLQLLEARYPFGPYAEQAQLEIIYAHYLNYEAEASIAAADRFIRLHPQHPNVDYAYYIKGLANYYQEEGLMSQYLPTDVTKRDPGAALQSFEDFRQLLYRFPESPYAADAKARMIYLRNRLARHEINVANYYFKRGAYLAAANRGRYVVENYPQTPATGDALAVMIQAYQLLGLNDLANDSLNVLLSNYPEHPSIDEEGHFKSEFSVGEAKRSWINRVSFGLFDRSAPPEFDNRADYFRVK